jgi:predicted anti-sigma-YlaC factor YlaD
VPIDHRVRCDEVVELVSDYLEGALEPADREALEQHVLICSACADYIEQMRTTLALASRLRVTAPLDDGQLEPLLQLFLRANRGERDP